MKNILACFFLIQSSISLQAQKVSYEKLEELSTTISKIQFEANGLSYNDGKTNYEISFPEENFQVFFNNQLATKAVYKKSDGKDVLYLNENIDLSKVIGISINDTDKQVIVAKLLFPKGSLKNQLIENGNLIKIVNEDSLYFFCVNVKETGTNLFYSLFDLCTKMKKEIGLITESEIETQKSDFKSLPPQAFALKHPTSLFVMQANLNIKRVEEEIREKKRLEQMEYNKVLSYIDSLCLVYKFKSDLTEKEFRNYNPEASNTLKKSSWIKPNELLYYSKGNKNRVIGPSLMYIVDGTVTEYSLYLMVSRKENTQTQLYYSNLLNDVKKNIPSKYIKIIDTSFFRIIHPKIKTKVDVIINYYNPSYWGNTSYVSLEFQVE